MSKLDGQSPGDIRRRGRPPKFGRPSRLLALTLPDDVIEWLLTLDPDPGRAIVGLFGRVGAQLRRHPTPPVPPDAEIASIGSGRGLILVHPEDVEGLPNVAAIPFVGGRAFLALEPGQSIADLELAVVDAIDACGLEDTDRRTSLRRFRETLRTWRNDPGYRFRERAIIVVERVQRRGRLKRV